jgi:hypothetical protein
MIYKKTLIKKNFINIHLLVINKYIHKHSIDYLKSQI